VLAERQMGGFLAISALVGIGVGLGAAGLVQLIDLVENLLGGMDLDEGSVWLFGTVPIGFLLAWFIALKWAPEVAGDGVPEAKAALIVHGGHIRGRAAPLKILATAATVGTGGSAGREGPIVQIGAAIGSWVSRTFRLGEDQVRSLVAAGAAAAIGASFNAPIAGMLFALEVILSSFAVRHMSAIVIASVTAAVTTRTIVGEELAIRTGTYRSVAASELLLYLGMALVVVIVGLIFLRVLDATGRFAETHASRLGPLRPLVTGLMVAGLVFVEPRLFGTGQEVTNTLLLGGQLDGALGLASEAWWFFALLALGKALATSLTISSGGSGGAFMPSLLMGAAVGTGFAVLVEPAWGDLQVGAFAVVGMAAMFAVVARAPLTAILIVFEVTGANDYQLILPLMLAATLGTFLAERFSADSVYTMPLRRQGIKEPSRGEVDILDTVSVGEVMSTPEFVASPDDSLAVVDGQLHRYRYHGIPVVDQGRLVGIITVSDIARSGGPNDAVFVREAMTPHPVTVEPNSPVSTALERMAVLGVGRIPVVAADDPGRVVGVFRREDAVAAYHEALVASTDIEMHRARLAQRTDPGAGYYDFRVPPGSIADGRPVKEVAWPEGITLVSVRRGREVVVPTGETVLLSGDVLTAFGTEMAQRQAIERLNHGADEPTAEIKLEELLNAATGDLAPTRIDDEPTEGEPD
jgi:CIC family chloride channel protein